MRIHRRIKTPCIGVCSTGIGDSVCRGCKRFTHEIIDWNGYSEDEKRNVLNRLNHLLAQVVKARFSVVNQARLKQCCEQLNIRFNLQADAYCWLFDLLKAGASQIQTIEHYGCAVLPHYEHMSLLELRDDIDKDFFALSEVHYERYFVQPITYISSD